MVHRNTAKHSKAKPKTILRLPDLEQSKTAVLHSLGAVSSQESYRHAIEEFIGWYCSEPRLAFNRTVVLRYRFFLEQKRLAPSTINVRMAAVRRLAYEAADTGLLSRNSRLASAALKVSSDWASGSGIGSPLSRREIFCEDRGWRLSAAGATVRFSRY
jgi:hypothetical protein